MRKITLAIISLIAVFTIIYSFKLKFSLTEKETEIEDLNTEIQKLNAKLDNFVVNKTDNKHTNELNSLNLRKDSLDIERIEYLEKLLDFENNKSHETDVYLGMISKTKYKENIISTSLNNSYPDLSKVKIRLNGNEEIIDFYNQMFDEYYWLYMESKIKK